MNKKIVSKQKTKVVWQTIGSIYIITLNVNCLNILDKTQKLSEWINKHEPAICYLQETHFKYNKLGMLKRQKYVNPWLIHVNV